LGGAAGEHAGGFQPALSQAGEIASPGAGLISIVAASAWGVSG
jgi:hypothetical protein